MQQPRLIVLAIDDDTDADRLLRRLAAGPRMYGARLADFEDVYRVDGAGIPLRDVVHTEKERQDELAAETREQA